MSTALVSVFMPTYNQAAMVDAAIRSVLDQDYGNVELVIGDDGSSDGTADIVSRWASARPDRIRVVADGSHVGLVANFNRILGACRGELIAFIGGDDLFLPGKIATQVDWMRQEPEIRLTCHDLAVFDSESGLTRYNWYAREGLPPREPAALVRHGNPFHPLGAMVRRSTVPATGFDERLPLANDWKFFVDCCGGAATFRVYGTVLARYRQWSGNVSRRDAEMFRDLSLTLDLVEEEYPVLADACRRRRADLFAGRGRLQLRRGDAAEARHWLWASLRARAASPGTAAWLALALCPAGIRRLALAAAPGRGSAS